MIACGIDLSLTSAGVATIDEEGRVDTAAVGESGHAGASWRERSERVGRQAERVLALVPAGAHVVIEGPAYGAFSTSTWDRAGLWHAVVAGAAAKGCAVSVAPPANVKLFLAGHAHAGKAAMVAYAKAASGMAFATDDEADAYALAAMGRARLDGQARRGLGGVEWAA